MCLILQTEVFSSVMIEAFGRFPPKLVSLFH
ncbi:hypothetical protein C5167_042236 [Papaver somniferum]|uniref:Uncharacterized protein n=1 Tax=Papaver somniferum TaxID=3469 RepID=A0A4Y7L4V4_PAPSO|nr:hypothetical protein C5167_042236 [Papaver somniferum]